MWRAAFVATGLLACTGRAVVDPATDAASVLDALPAHHDGAGEGEGAACFQGTVRAGSNVTCVAADPGRDCVGHLCVEAFPLYGPAPPEASLGRVCYPGVDLGQGRFQSYLVRYALPAVPPAPVLVSAFLAESNPQDVPPSPVAGDPWHYPPTVTEGYAKPCITQDLLLDERF